MRQDAIVFQISDRVQQPGSYVSVLILQNAFVNFHLIATPDFGVMRLKPCWIGVIVVSHNGSIRIQSAGFE